MRCENPIILKSGLVVPCGKCLLCLSSRRDEWSRRLQLHTYGYAKPPFFVTLTYDDDHLPHEDGVVQLRKRDFSLFVKRLKDRLKAYNSDFSVFGCGEYGDLFQRPHGHILIFGCNQLYELFDIGYKCCHDFLLDVWCNGNVDIGLAGFDGIHYVTKYVLKYNRPKEYDGLQKPFLFASHGLGSPWLETAEARHLVYRLKYYRTPSFVLDDSSIWTLRDSAVDAYNQILDDAPRLVCTLPDGVACSIPRYLRKKIIGSFEHFKDNPLWVLTHLKMVADSCNYYINHSENDASNEEYSTQLLKMAKRRIKTRLIQNGKL